MKGWRFYEELEHKNRKAEESKGTVIAIAPELWHYDYARRGHRVYDALVAVQDYPNCPVAGSGVSDDYLRDECRHISEAKAREIHPELFRRLDEEDA